MASSTPNTFSRHELALWTGLLGAPVIWSGTLEISYALAPYACHAGSLMVLHVLTIVCIVMALIGGLISYRQWRATDAESPDKIDGGPIARKRFLGAMGLVASIFFALAMIAQEIAGFFFNPCWT